MKSNFKHDCELCHPLGEFTHAGTVYDLYWCCSKNIPSLPSLLARFGNGPEYFSSLPPECFDAGFEPNAVEREILARGLVAGLYKPWHAITEANHRAQLAEVDLKVAEAVLEDFRSGTKKLIDFDDETLERPESEK